MADQSERKKMKIWKPVIKTYYIFRFLLLPIITSAQIVQTSAAHSSEPTKIIVDINGSGNFRSLQEAINSLPDSASVPRTIFIRRGTYNEKIFITKHNIIIEGEERDRTIITQDIARDEWRCDHPDDWGVATININGNDITLKNLTIENGYGFH